MEGVVTTLALLACPVGMGLMMLFMFRGMRGDREPPSDKPSLDYLRAEHRRITSDLERRRDASHRERRVGASS